MINYKNKNNNIKSDAGFYSNHCLGCNRKYVSENSRSIKKMYVHKSDIKTGHQKYVSKIYLETNHNFIFKDSKIINIERLLNLALFLIIIPWSKDPFFLTYLHN